VGPIRAVVRWFSLAAHARVRRHEKSLAAVSPAPAGGASHRYLGRRRTVRNTAWRRLSSSLVLASVLALAGSAATTGLVTAESDVEAVARTRAALELNVPEEDVETLYMNATPVTLVGRSYRTGLFSSLTSGEQAFIAVDTGSVTSYNSREYSLLYEAELNRPDRDKFTPTARALLGTGSAAWYAFLLGPLDYEAAEEVDEATDLSQVVIHWPEDVPRVTDEEDLERQKEKFLRASLLTRRFVEPFVAAADAVALTQSIPLELAPIVFAQVTPTNAELLAARPDVIEVRHLAGHEEQMSSVRPTIDSDDPYRRFHRGGGTYIAVVEYRRVGASTDIPFAARAATKYISSRVARTSDWTTLPCRDRSPSSSASGHMTIVAQIALGRQSYGVAPEAMLVEASANAVPGDVLADPRVLRAAECAVMAGARIVNLSLSQNDDDNRSADEAYFDHLAGAHHVFIAAAAGNKTITPIVQDSCLPGPAGGRYQVPAPASAWNVLAVGATNDNAATDTATTAPGIWSNDTLRWRSDLGRPAYCWDQPRGRPGEVRDRIKPEISAVGEIVNVVGSSTDNPPGGTSFATPQVSGAAALVLDAHLAYYGSRPEVTQALLLATARGHKTPTPSGVTSIEYEGLGTLRVDPADNVAWGGDVTGGAVFLNLRGFETGYPACPYAQPRAFRLSTPIKPQSGKTLTVVMRWFSKTFGHRSTADERASDLNLDVVRGATHFRSLRQASNLEFVDITYAQATDHWVYVRPAHWDCFNRTQRIGLAWKSY
jgi:subtilisin family serine protease